MNDRNVVICDEELRYAKRLSENMQKKTEFAVKVYVCSSLEHARQCMKDKTIHIFIVSGTYRYEERKRIKAERTFVLKRGEILDLGTDECAIEKYQCADEIIRQVFEGYMEHTKQNLVRTRQRGEGKLIAVYSPIHRIGKTTFALALAGECAKQKKTLYLNLEEYAGFEGAAETGVNLGDLLYYLKQEESTFGIRLQAAVRKSGDLEYILPISMSTDLKEIAWNEWRLLLENIVKNSAYECVILDIGESVQGLCSILELCNRIYMPILKDSVSQLKIRRYEEMLEKLKKEKIKCCTYQFVMPEKIEEYAKIRAKEEC